MPKRQKELWARWWRQYANCPSIAHILLERRGQRRVAECPRGHNEESSVNAASSSDFRADAHIDGRGARARTRGRICSHECCDGNLSHDDHIPGPEQVACDEGPDVILRTVYMVRSVDLKRIRAITNSTRILVECQITLHSPRVQRSGARWCSCLR